MGFQLWHGSEDLVFGGYQDNFFFSHNPKIRPLPKKWVKGFIKLEGMSLEESGRLYVAKHPDKVVPEDDLKGAVVEDRSSQCGGFPVVRQADEE